MYLLSNAIKNLERNKSRNALIAVVTLAIVMAAVVTLTINNAAARIIDTIRLDLGSRVEIRQDFIEMRQIGLGRDDAAFVPIASFMQFAESAYLRNSVFNAAMYAWSDSFRAVDDFSETPGSTTRINDNGEVVLVETSRLVGTSEPASLADFGSFREISQGRMFENLNEAIISEELAVQNALTIGDTITLSAAYSDGIVYTLEIVGIYADRTEPYVNFFLAMNGRFADNRRNEIITSFDTLIAGGWQTNAGLDMQVEYFLADPANITAFEAEVRALGLPITYNVAINQAAFDRVTGPLAGMHSAATTFMFIVLILGAITLALISYMAVRERKYEVGVLRAMGLERAKVAFGILAETVIIAAVCLILGLGIGNAISQPIADFILEGRVATANQEISETGGANRVLFAGGQMQTDDAAQGYTPASEIQISLEVAVILQIIAITLALAALSGIIGVVIISQYEPLKILRER
ncbi:MAG: ABC transporter permease [Defluviitaleaceae bacterium]|nr:ABC transporter permease [Defluviitaleaceae bacterium]